MPHRAYIDPVNVFGGLLLNTDKPGRYTGGEFGILSDKTADFQTLIAFPDLYEIGMSNQALRIIYNNLNNIDGVSCDRAFAPAPDFEKLLRDKKIPLYGLDTGIALSSVDLLMFTLGYELGLNGILLMLDVSGIPLRCIDRNENHPIIIAGGPAVSNPLPYSPFIDAFWIGEAEAGFFELVNQLAHSSETKRGQSSTTKKALLKKITSNPNVWSASADNSSVNARRAIYTGFSSCKPIDDNKNVSLVYPVPSMKTVQHHGTVEIMRGCPNGCRFCHAGFWYRPMRQKSKEQIILEAGEMIRKGGWRQVSLSSLSSGDYNDIDGLIEELNRLFKNDYVSFQLSSLRVSGFSLSLLEKLSVTRKSGLTFAIETPLDTWQMSINKDVSKDSVVSILEEAKKRGWKSAKFYFMLGLPLPHDNIMVNEEKEIVNFISDVGKRTRMRFNINAGIFIPKPHTPYQSVRQIDSETALKKLEYIRFHLKPLGHKVSVSNPLVSLIEGILSRGDQRAGLLCEDAFLNGSRLDAWDEFINKEKWQEIINNNSKLIDELIGKKKLKPIWHEIKSCIADNFLISELEKSDNSKRTASCNEKCRQCGVCNEKCTINTTSKGSKNAPLPIANQNNSQVNEKNPKTNKRDVDIFRMLFSFSKTSSAVFHGHLSLIEIFSMAFSRANLPVMYTKGFNPIVKMEFASPLTCGIHAGNEIASVDFPSYFQPELFKDTLNQNLPKDFSIKKAKCFCIPCGKKKHSLSSLLWGFAYKGADGNMDLINCLSEKVYRRDRLEKENITLFDLFRNEVLAKNILDDVKPDDYFKVYSYLYPHT